MHEIDLTEVSAVIFSETPNPYYRVLARAALDLSECRTEADYWHEVALRDVVTGLPNRLAFDESLTEYFNKVSGDPRRRVGLGYIDLDEFKAANDRYGHEYGDQILKFTADIISKTVKPWGKLYRVGGDEFAILFNRVSDLRDDPEGSMLRYAKELESLVTTEYEASPLLKAGLRVGASIAIVRSIENESIHDLLHRADMKMYEQKASKSANR